MEIQGVNFKKIDILNGEGGVEFFLENPFITLSFDVSAKRFLQTVAKILHALHLRR